MHVVFHLKYITKTNPLLLFDTDNIYFFIHVSCIQLNISFAFSIIKIPYLETDAEQVQF